MFTRITFLLLFSLTLVSNIVFSDQEIISTDGREILLKDDGRWMYRSNDRFANTTDGRRVRLKEDGSWEYAGHAPLVSTEQVRTADLDIKLDKVVIEEHEKKIQKNTRVKTQTVFYLTVEPSPLMQRNVRVRQSDISHIKVVDNNGKNYPVISIQPNAIDLMPGTTTIIVVRAHKSPAFWDTVKSMKIILNSGILGLQEPISFSQSVANFESKKVDGFAKSN